MTLCSCPKSLATKVVYADENSGHIHLCLPFYVDVCGECHLSLYRGCCCSGAVTLCNHPQEIQDRRQQMGRVMEELQQGAHRRRKMKVREAIAKLLAAKEGFDKDALLRAVSRSQEYPPTKQHRQALVARSQCPFLQIRDLSSTRCWSPASEFKAQHMRLQQPRLAY